MGSRRVRRRLLVIAMVAAFSLVSSACEVIQVTWPGNIGAAHYSLQHDYGIAVPIPGYSNYPVQSCLFRSGYDTKDPFTGEVLYTHADICRVVLGMEEHEDLRNWHVYTDPPPLSYQWISGHGYSIVTHNGQSFEGCKRLSAPYGTYDDWECDYKIIAYAPMVRGRSQASYILEKFRDWAIHTGSAVGCARFVTGVGAGASLTYSGLAGCALAPL